MNWNKLAERLPQAHRETGILLAIAAFWFALFIFSGSLFSGFHFTDDHDIVAIYYHLTAKQMSLPEVIVQWLKDDHATGRFRIFYFITRIIQTSILGIHFFGWSVFTGLLAVFTTFGFYLFGRQLNFSIQESLLFALLTTLGAQSAVWWQLGPAETIATFLLSIALVFTALSTQPSRFQWVYTGLCIIFAIAMSLSKENFILMIPAIACIKLFLSKQNTSSSWYRTIQKNILTLFILLAICCLELLFVKYFVGLTPQIGYAGFDGLNAGGIFNAIKRLSNSGGWWIILVGAGLIVLLSFSPEPDASGKFPSLKSFYLPITLFILIAVPQIVIYAKSDITQRYLLPGILAYSFLIIWIYRYLRETAQPLDKLILLLIVATLAVKLQGAWNSARIFALEGRSTNALLQAIEANTQPDDPILIVTNTIVYWEWNFSIKKYLNYVSDRDNLYLVSYGQAETPLSRKVPEFYHYQTLEKLPDKGDTRCIVIFPLLKPAFLRNSADWFREQDFQESAFGHFNRNLDPNSTIHLYCKKS